MFGHRGRLRWTEDGVTRARDRSVYRLDGGGLPVEFGVHSNNIDNLRRGVVERVLGLSVNGKIVLPAQPVAGAWDSKWLKQFSCGISQRVGTLQPGTYDEFVKLYEGDRRQRIYAGAVESLKLSPVNPSDAVCSTFVKCEKLNLSNKPDPSPRVIQPRTPRYNASVGRYLKKLEKKVCDAIAATFGGPTVMKGYNALETAKHMRDMWEAFDDVVAVGLDASRFDQRCTIPALKYEHGVYNAIYRCPELARLLRWQLKNTGIGRTPEGKVKYEVNGCRMSGDMNTSLGNCLLMSAMVWALGKELNIPLRLANNGDDCVVFMSRVNLVRFNAAVRDYFTKLGFDMKVEEPVFEFEHIEFCQTKPVWRGEEWIMCRDPRVSLAKDSHTVLPMEQRGALAAYCKAVGDCGMSLTGGLPVMQEYYKCLLRSGGATRSKHQTVTETGFNRLASGMHLKERAVQDDTRVSFWAAFGIMPWQQELLEKHYAHHTFHPKVHRREVRSPDFSIAASNFVI